MHLSWRIGLWHPQRFHPRFLGHFPLGTCCAKDGFQYARSGAGAPEVEGRQISRRAPGADGDGTWWNWTSDFGSSTMFQGYDVVWYATCVFCFDTFLETRANMLKSIGYGLDFDRDGHVTFARELWQPDRVNFSQFWPILWRRLWQTLACKFP